jgi:tetratricopeptide (TPR) repeat protein
MDVIHGVEKGRRERAFAMVRQALPAAIMLHTESGLSLNWLGDSAAAATQWRHAEMLAALEPATPEQAAFLRAWHQALGLYFLGSYAVEEAVDLLGRGLERFPDDAPIALALGQAYEARGTFARGRTLSLQVRPSRDSMRDLRAAEDLLQGLVARDPALAEARLHLGRVLDLTGRSDAALAEFREVAAGGAPRQRYLAHLFAGELLRRRSRLAEAREEFTQATGAWPGGQAAAIGMSETLHRLGERAAAASTLTEAIEDRGGPPPADPFRTYHFGDRAEQKRLLETVKATVRR